MHTFGFDTFRFPLLSYVFDNFHPALNDDKGWEIKYRLECVAKAALLLAGGVTDVALGVIFYVPAKLSELADVKWKRIQKFKNDGYKALDETLPKVHRSFLRAINPDAKYYKNGVYRDVDFLDRHFEDCMTEPLLRKIEKRSRDDSFLVSQVSARLLALATVPVAITACALDIISQPIFFTASILLFGKDDIMNTYARNHLRLYSHIEGIAMPIFYVIYPKYNFFHPLK